MVKKEAKLSTVKKRVNEFKCKLEYNTANQKVFRFHCIDCKMWESRINLMKNFNETWICPGTTVVEKYSLKKHINSAPHKQAVELGNKRNLGAASYTQEIIEKTPTRHGLKQMCTDYRKALEYKFNTAYYLALEERPFTDFPKLLTLQEKNGIKSIGKAYLTNNACTEFTDYRVEVTKNSLKTNITIANYYACFNNGRTDLSIIERGCLPVVSM